MSARRRRATRRKPPSPPVTRGVKHPAVFTIAPSAPFAETLARGLIARLGDDPLGTVVGHHLSADPPRGPQLRRCLRAGAGRRGAVAAIPRPGRQRGRRSAVRCRQRRLGAGARHRALAAAIAAGAAGPAMGSRGTRRHLVFRPRRRAGRQPGQRDGRGRNARAAISRRLKDLAPQNLAEHWEGVTRFLAVIRDALAGHSGGGKGDQSGGAAQPRRLQALAKRLEDLAAARHGDRRRFDRLHPRHRANCWA